MRRHNPGLYPHQELDEDEESFQRAYSAPAMAPSASSGGTSSRARNRPRTRVAFGSSSNVPSNKHPDLYSQWVLRYRSSTANSDDPRDDPDSHYFQRNVDQLQDAGDSDDEDLSRFAATENGIQALILESELLQPASEKDRERLEWHAMLASVLGGDVLKSEKTRIAFALDANADEKSIVKLNIWLGIRAKFSGRSVQEEKKMLEDRRIRTVDHAIEALTTFRADVPEDAEDSQSLALHQVSLVLHRLDIAHSLYPTIKALHVDKPACAEPDFQARMDALNTWSHFSSGLRYHIRYLQQWTGSKTLDVTARNTSKEIPITLHPPDGQGASNLEVVDNTSFVERLLKEESMQRTFEKGALLTIHTFVSATREAQINYWSLFQEMNLPKFEQELVPLLSFPTKLAQGGLRVRIQYAKRLAPLPDEIIIDQTLEDLKVSIGLACMLKRQYENFLHPHPEGTWVVPPCIGDDYDATILEGLQCLFNVISLKLKHGKRAIYFKETDLLEQYWATFNDVSLTVTGGSVIVAEQLCSLTNRLMVRVTNYFDTQVRVPTGEEAHEHRHELQSYSSIRQSKEAKAQPLLNGTVHESNRKMTADQKAVWYGKILDSVRLRYRKLQRFARALTDRFGNAAEYNIDDVQLDVFISHLIGSDHFLVYTHRYEEEGIYIVASNTLFDRPERVKKILAEAFTFDDSTGNEGGRDRVDSSSDFGSDMLDDIEYVLLLSPSNHFLWTGRVMLVDIDVIDFETKENRVRLIADGSQHRLAIAKDVFNEVLNPIDEDGEPLEDGLSLNCLTSQQAHLPNVNRELRKIARSTNKLAESIVDSVHHVRSSLRASSGCQELLENWYAFASEHGQHAQRHMDHSSSTRFTRLLIRLAISWLSFICDDCEPTDRKTFKWAVNALEFTLHRTVRSILHLPEEQFKMLRSKVASCMTLLMSHFDILGARSTIEATRQKERQEELMRARVSEELADEDEEFTGPIDDCMAFTESSTRLFWDRLRKSLEDVEGRRLVVGSEHRVIGRVLDNEKLEDRSLVFLANSTSNISIRWQQGRFIGAGAFGSVYLAVNLDSGSLMAVKEVKFQELTGVPNLYSQIKDELHVMEMLHHPNVVEYYGIEVHRDKVYIFEEYCQGGSLAALLEHGRIEDERIIQVYTMQMLEGLSYLHSKGIVHRDVKPDNILLDHLGVIKFVDFGAAKIFARNQRTIHRTRRAVADIMSPQDPAGGLAGMAGMGKNNSLTGTPMYMSPEVIKNDTGGRHGAMDIWSLGCVVLEFATGKKPWSNLDNEWAIMFHIGVATQHPPLPEPGQLSEMGVDFIKQCLTIDAYKRPSATELTNHPWMLDFRAALLSYEEAEIGDNPPSEMPTDESFDLASVARQAVLMQEKEAEEIQAASPVTSSSASLSNSARSTPESLIEEP